MTDEINERSVEIPWLLRKVEGMSPHRLLDVGSADAQYHWELIATGAACTFQDVRPFTPSLHPSILERITLHVGAPPFPPSFNDNFDLVTCVSVLDHVGLPAYGQPKDSNALNTLVTALRDVMQDEGALLLTVPVGIPTVYNSVQCVFSLDELLSFFPIPHWEFQSIEWYRLENHAYKQVPDWSDVCTASYRVSQARAEAVACIELMRRKTYAA